MHKHERVCMHTDACACARTRVHTKWIRAGRWVAHLRERRISVDSDDAAHGQRVPRKLRHELAGRGHPQLDLPVGPAAHDLHREVQWLPSGPRPSVSDNPAERMAAHGRRCVSRAPAQPRL
jgi:hypothetical protein